MSPVVIQGRMHNIKLYIYVYKQTYYIMYVCIYIYTSHLLAST